MSSLGAFPVFEGSNSEVKEILGFFEVFLGTFEKIRQKSDRRKNKAESTNVIFRCWDVPDEGLQRANFMDQKSTQRTRITSRLPAHTGTHSRGKIKVTDRPLSQSTTPSVCTLEKC